MGMGELPQSGCQKQLSAAYGRTDLDVFAVGFHRHPQQAGQSDLICEGKQQNAWAYCLDSPCKIVDGEVICSCSLAEKSDYYTFAGNCETEQTCQKLWSAAALPDLLGG